MTNSNESKKGILLALLAGASWGAMGIFVKNLEQLGFSPMAISSLRPTIAILPYIIINLIKDPQCFKTDLKGLLLFAIYGIFALDGMFIGSSYAVKYTGVATASVLLFVNPVIVMILSYFLFKEKFTVNKIIALVLTLVGCCLVVKAYDPAAFKVNLIGVFWGIISSFAMALQNILGRIGTEKYPQKTHLTYSLLFGAIFLWFFEPPWTLVSLIKNTGTNSTILNVLALGIVSTLIPTIAIVKSLEFIESSKASIIASVEPVVASILAFIIFGEIFEIPQLIGMFMIMGSIILVQTDGKKSKLEASTEKSSKKEVLKNESDNSNNTFKNKVTAN
ncbi:DMT family transporter [Clostridium cochlearium]|jgi:drug/metabolite transporter (DMT)-like permease|uniref:Transporter n=3 Tax=Clostridium cochlearium TaxID=1494 RepID=A0A240AGQ8_CLOCO|nr:EamA family transporter [Clostridium cochlearium]MBV1820078.1 DMT family transporter [Bacteroidales bacterium MSK.15.36]NSJ91988.1 EamA family transporter [Coprococcus sp. MSK.21.13]MBE6064919.1 hypothetical protein [Clostridium cochlearium]MBU5270268.1 DMT family transporter [Clostridium cochlearium]MCG4571564.1 DMT family transporter [Clostridium cochlearium]